MDMSLFQCSCPRQVQNLDVLCRGMLEHFTKYAVVMVVVLRYNQDALRIGVRQERRVHQRFKVLQHRGRRRRLRRGRLGREPNRFILPVGTVKHSNIAMTFVPGARAINRADRVPVVQSRRHLHV
jgi:hypothetical protein